MLSDPNYLLLLGEFFTSFYLFYFHLKLFTRQSSFVYSKKTQLNKLRIYVSVHVKLMLDLCWKLQASNSRTCVILAKIALLSIHAVNRY